MTCGRQRGADQDAEFREMFFACIQAEESTSHRFVFPLESPALSAKDLVTETAQESVRSIRVYVEAVSVEVTERREQPALPPGPLGERDEWNLRRQSERACDEAQRLFESAEERMSRFAQDP